MMVPDLEIRSAQKKILTWEQADNEIGTKLKAIAASGGKIALIL
jgi:hypothetical protein